MLTPTIATRTTWFYAFGNTPAISLTKSVPHGEDVAVLSLGSGDLRNVLYTAYLEKGLPPRKLDVTCCDMEEKIIARNLVLLSFLLDEATDLSNDSLWNSYYHMFVNSATANALHEQTTKLLSISKTLKDWAKSEYGHAIKFCDADTLIDVRRVWKRIKNAAEKCQKEGSMVEFGKNVRTSRDLHDKMMIEKFVNVAGLRSIAPLSLHSQNELNESLRRYWHDNFVTFGRAEAQFPNPLLAGLLSETEILHYASDPVQFFHLATAYAPLADSSPLKPPKVEDIPKTTAAAKTQFSEWVSAFKLIFGKTMVLRFATAEALVFCHSLQCAAEGILLSHLYRRPGDARQFRLDPNAYVKNGEGRVTFDLIDTSNLSHHIGALNILVAAGPLINDQPWATLLTDVLINRQRSGLDTLESVLCGDAPTVSLLLGLSPVEYWTNVKYESHVDELFKESTQTAARVAWKLDHQFSGYPEGWGRLQIEANSLVRLLLPISRSMFGPGDPTVPTASGALQGGAYPYFHHGSYAALVKVIKKRVQTDWGTFHTNLLDSISQDPALLLSSNMTQDFGAQLHLLGVGTQPWLQSEVKYIPGARAFSAWKSIPPVVSVTLVVPHNAISRLHGDFNQKTMMSPTLIGSLKNAPGSSSMWHNMFGDVHIAFGNLQKTSTPDKDDFEVSIEQDEAGWSGTAPLFASFYVPTAALQVEPKHTLVGLMVQLNKHTAQIWGPILGIDMCVFQANLNDHANVFVTKYIPGQEGYPVICAHVKEPVDPVEGPRGDQTTKLRADVPAFESRLTTITGHLNFTSEKGKKLLKDKVPIELRQENPFVIDVVFGRNVLICPVRFPTPVTKDGSKTRIARASGYIEVLAPIARHGASKELSGFVFPITLSPEGVPSAINAPHLNLDVLPIADLQSDHDKLKWLTTLTSLQFSAREKRLRDNANTVSGISSDSRVNFKESLFTMFMLSSGLQGGQTGLFAINHPEQGGIHMLIFVSALRLDGESGSVVLDAAAIPFTAELIESGKMESFLLILRTLECCTLQVNDEELALWKKALPSLAERCRTWSHGPQCEYKKHNATIPLSLKQGQAVLCSCGNGKIPDNFVTLPEWETAAANAVRVAISPLYAVPFVEEAVDQNLIGGLNSLDLGTEMCRNCGKLEGTDGISLKRCNRCLKAKYCSGECQKKDWKKHRMECKEAKEG